MLILIIAIVWLVMMAFISAAAWWLKEGRDRANHAHMPEQEDRLD